jgi:macrocin-O-methyltransferase TylF-like protien
MRADIGDGALDCENEYLELLKLALVDLLGHETFSVKPRPEGGMEVHPLAEEGRFVRLEGRDWPANATTMVGMGRLNHLQACVEEVIATGVPGDLIETGVWRGGAAILMRAVLRVRGAHDRAVWAADSFEGLPAPDEQRYPADHGSRLHEQDFLSVSLEDVQRNFARFGMLDDQVRFVPGWFNETLPALETERWSLIRLDADLYESTLVALEQLYPRLQPGGFVIADDYWLRSSREAIHDYRARHGIEEEIQPIDWAGAYWRKR